MGSFVVFPEQGTWKVRRDADLLPCGEHLETFSRRKLRFDGLVNISTAGYRDGIGALMWMGPAKVSLPQWGEGTCCRDPPQQCFAPSLLKGTAPGDNTNLTLPTWPSSTPQAPSPALSPGS